MNSLISVDLLFYEIKIYLISFLFHQTKNVKEQYKLFLKVILCDWFDPLFSGFNTK